MSVYFRVLAISSVALAAFVPAVAAGAPSKPLEFKLQFTDNFDGSKLNSRIWKRMERPAWGGSDWIKHMSPRPDLSEVKGGMLALKGVKNTDLESDARPYLTGGITTKDLLNMKYGKVEARIRFKGARGAWPAFWMMPQDSPNGWLAGGEIDIFEYLNYDNFVYHTIHSSWTRVHPNDPPRTNNAEIKPEAWNIYALEWTPDKLVWRVNGKITHAYEKKTGVEGEGQWPFDAPFYIMLDMQLGGAWVGSVDESTLPAEMQVDWVKFYHLMRGKERISEFKSPKRKAK
ncbi:MAG: glycoside hydrolase family 16 protein [Kiritimatiellae bacterium]|nr:glycoside hydrolase family 16 protein [Kiritimatiellia bacterium]